MAEILLFGAGKSASYLIRHFLESASRENYLLHVVDPAAAGLEQSYQTYGDYLRLHAVSMDDRETLHPLFERAGVVISLLPPALHPRVAENCLHYGKHLVTASYAGEEMRHFDAAAREKGLVFLNEAGLDPGIDHMSALKMIHNLQENGSHIREFYSYTGGLVAPESDTNLWHYKLSWNPRNVVLAGSGAPAQYLENSEVKLVSYPQLFQRLVPFEHETYGRFEGYPNRDSLSYRDKYGLEEAETLLRGTLRRPGYAHTWNILVQLGLTDDQLSMNIPEGSSGRYFLNRFLPYHPSKSLEEKLQNLAALDCREDDIERLMECGLLDENYKLPVTHGTAAQILQAVLEEKWKLASGDRDMIVMIHRVIHEQKGKQYRTEASLVLEGEDEIYTAMAKTVGLPAAFCAEEILSGRFREAGVQIPDKPALYLPVLKRLEAAGIRFVENSVLMS